jgi:hypothetical protein
MQTVPTTPSLNVDVARLLKSEFHRRMQVARMRRQHELEALVKSGKLAVGHCRVRALHACSCPCTCAPP